MEDNNMAYIELKNVSYKYPLSKEPSLKNVTVSLEKGKFYGVIGGNAGGKTTLCNLIRGLIPHFYKGKLSGSVIIDGESIESIDIDILATQIGYIFQNPFTQISGVRKTVFEEIALGMENLGVKKETIIERVFTIANELKIEELLQNNPNALSGGQRQKVAFASVLAMDSDTLVIDEPTSQLDPEGTAGIFEIIDTLKKQGKTIVLVEHKIDLLAQYADEVLVMQNGRMIAQGRTEDVLADFTLLERGVMLPQTVFFNHELECQGLSLDNVPVTRDACIQQLRNKINGE